MAVTAARLLRLLLRLLRLQLLLRVVCAWLGTEVGLKIQAVAVGGLDLDRVQMALALKTRHSRGVGAGCGLAEVQAGLGRGQQRMDRGRRAGLRIGSEAGRVCDFRLWRHGPPLICSGLRLVGQMKPLVPPSTRCPRKMLMCVLGRCLRPHRVSLSLRAGAWWTWYRPESWWPTTSRCWALTTACRSALPKCSRSYSSGCWRLRTSAETRLEGATCRR